MNHLVDEVLSNERTSARWTLIGIEDKSAVTISGMLLAPSAISSSLKGEKFQTDKVSRPHEAVCSAYGAVHPCAATFVQIFGITGKSSEDFLSCNNAWIDDRKIFSRGHFRSIKSE